MNAKAFETPLKYTRNELRNCLIKLSLTQAEICCQVLADSGCVLHSYSTHHFQSCLSTRAALISRFHNCLPSAVCVQTMLRQFVVLFISYSYWNSFTNKLEWQRLRAADSAIEIENLCRSSSTALSTCSCTCCSVHCLSSCSACAMITINF